MTQAFIYDAVRTPRGRGKSDGSLHDVQPIQLLTSVLRELKNRNQLDTALLDDVIVGCVTPIGEQGADIARTAVIEAGYAETVAGVQLNRFCSSGLEAINMAAAYVLSGQFEAVVAGGVESMSRVPIGSDGGALFMNPQIVARHNIVPQGISADLIATKYGFSRADADAFAAESYRRATIAQQENRFGRTLVAIKDDLGTTLLDRDEGVRPGTTAESLSKLKPAFEAIGKAGFDALALLKYADLAQINHIHHAGNSSQIVDGAAGLLIGSKEFGEKTGLKPRARIRAFAVIGTEPTIMLTGVVPATQKVLKKAGMLLSDIDLFEVNEAFAAIPLWHPLGATGAILSATLLDELERTGRQTGLATLCVGGGMGVATVFERIN